MVYADNSGGCVTIRHDEESNSKWTPYTTLLFQAGIIRNEANKTSNARVLMCPSLELQKTGYWSPIQFPYGAVHASAEANFLAVFGNAYFIKRDAVVTRYMLQYSRLKNGSSFPLLFDSVHVDQSNSAGFIRTATIMDNFTGALGLHFRHLNQVNVLYGDGHVGSKKPSTFRNDMLNCKAGENKYITHPNVYRQEDYRNANAL